LKVRNFVKKMVDLSGAKVELVDERFSSYAADRFVEGGVSRDEKSAMIILQTYLDKNAQHIA
jgi:RNase H-fold protein (predicted Holliday junction resolvase)